MRGTLLRPVHPCLRDASHSSRVSAKAHHSRGEQKGVRNRVKKKRNPLARKGSGPQQVPGSAKRGGRRERAVQDAAAAKAKQRPGYTAEHLTAPCKVTPKRTLAPPSQALAPWWSTFCGHSEGVWAGRYAAINLATGKLDVVSLDENKVKHKELLSHVTEQAAGHDDVPVLLRTTHRSARPPQPSSDDASSSSSGSGADADASADKQADATAHSEQEQLSSRAPGCLYFDGGSYSYSLPEIGTRYTRKNPEPLVWGQGSATSAAAAAPSTFDVLDDSPEATTAATSDTDKDTDAPEATEADAAGGHRDLAEPEPESDVAESTSTHRMSNVEHCLAVSGRERVRVVALLKTEGGHGGDELEVDILRIRMYRETWLGEVGGAGSAAAAAATAAATATRLEDAPRAAHKQHSGEFRRLTVAAMPVHEGDSGFSDSEVEAELAGAAYFEEEVEEGWQAGAPEVRDDGATWWLPAGVTLTVQQARDSAAGDTAQVDDAGEAPVPKAKRPPRRLLVRTTWRTARGVCSAMETEFSPEGKLREARFSSLVSVDNAVPSMNVPVARSKGAERVMQAAA